MAKPYKSDKRLKELTRMKKREEKMKKRLARKQAAESGAVPGDVISQSEAQEGVPESL